MSSSLADSSLHGGPRRVVELAARALGFGAAQATVVDGGEVRVVATSGPVREELELALQETAGFVRSGGPVSTPDTLGVSLRDPQGRPVGALCLAGRQGPPVGDEPSVLRSFATVLGDQLELLRQVSRLHDDGTASRELSLAIDRGEIVPWYQPILRMTTGELVGFEALARWQRPGGEIERPGAFIGLAEETGLVTALDMAVMAHAVVDLARWRERWPDLRVSVNFSGRHLDDEGWADHVHRIATDGGVPPESLNLELTESARPDDVVGGAGQLDALRARGYAIWLDDFGTGWSELQHLVQLPVDGVKIDRFFAEALGSRADAVVRALTKAAAEIGLGTTIEGISTPEHAARALALGCDVAQGFLWSQPVPADQAEELLRRPGALLTAAGR